ncbi:MAG: hypothetical protein ACRDCE_12535, partial [Cetobacterium sp.]|uniref:hypothetical protein n=1 Tax=Cetobacterium sp. TaxID=2071632 RepID=UPI003EE636EF
SSSISKQRCVKKEEMLILLYWPMEQTTSVTSHAVVLQDGGTVAPKALTKHPCLLYIFFIKVEITLVNNVNLTDCLISTLKASCA